MSLAYIALGSNLGDRLEHMRKSLVLLSSDFPVVIKRVSPVYQNRAVGMGEGADDFLNAVVELDTLLEPIELLDACLETEQRLGRVRTGEGWIPRTIDLDLLYFEDVNLNSERLTLPHPRIAERDFVAVPLSDLAPDLLIGGLELRNIVAQLDVTDLRRIDDPLFFGSDPSLSFPNRDDF